MWVSFGVIPLLPNGKSVICFSLSDGSWLMLSLQLNLELLMAVFKPLAVMARARSKLRTVKDA